MKYCNLLVFWQGNDLKSTIKKISDPFIIIVMSIIIDTIRWYVHEQLISIAWLQVYSRKVTPT